MGDCYECQECKTRIPADEVETTHEVWPEGADKTTSGEGRVEVQARPGNVLCRNSVHGGRPKQMRRIQEKE